MLMDDDVLLILLFCLLLLLHRRKRSGISDQRLMELETLLALERLREQLKDPVAFGLIDPDRMLVLSP